MKKILSNIWFYVVAGVGLLAYLLQSEKKKRQQAEAELQTAEYKKEDAVLAEKQANVQKMTAEEIAKLEAEKQRTLTPDEMAEYLKKL